MAIASMRLRWPAHAAVPAAFLLSRVLKWQSSDLRQTKKMADAHVNAMPGVDMKKPFSRVLLGGGCFWSVEKLIRKEFSAKLRGTAAGFAGGHTENPTYEEVCEGHSGHCEVVSVHFYEDQLPLEEILRFFWAIHDPTTPNRQGNDVGSQYRSAVFLYSAAHEDVAQRVRDEMQDKWKPRKIVTDIVGPGKWNGHFWPADAYHQLYLEKNPGGYCSHRKRF